MPAETPDQRLTQALAWAQQTLGENNLKAAPVSGDASFRRYFRLRTSDNTSLILMDAPPAQEDSRPFIDIAKRLRSAGICAPEIIAFDLDQGFGLLEDLGDTLYKGLLSEHTVDEYFPALFDVLAAMARDVYCEGLPEYDADRLQQELDLFSDWYLSHHRKRPFSEAEQQTWRALCEELLASAREQPQVFVHRDFHSCNLLWRKDQPPGVIDFQDGVRGPLSYDFISLAWDRYIHWPRNQIEQWMAQMHHRLAPPADLTTWTRQCDLMGLQRNLKVVGIFARLKYRDGKQGYLEMIPMFYQYLLDVLPRYPEFEEFHAILQEPSCAP